MATSFNRRNLTSRRVATGSHTATATNGGGAKTYYFPLDPSSYTSIIIIHNSGDTPLMSLTNTLDSNDDLEHANVLWAQEYDGTSTPFNGVQPSGYTGVKITVTPTSGDVNISISQFRKY